MIGGILALFFLIVFLAILNPFVQIGAGQRGVVMNWGKVQPYVFGEGLHFRMPISQSVQVISIKTQASNLEENAGTKDSQSVDVKLTVNWHLDPSKVNSIYQNIGGIDAVTSNILTNNIQDSVKSSTAKYEALDIQRNRDNVAQTALLTLQKKVKKYGVIVDGLSITNINFTADFNNAVEQAQVAQQQAKKAEYEVQVAKKEADAAVARATGQSQAQALLQQALTPELLQKMWIDKWNGNVPQTITGTGTGLFLGVK